MMEQWIDEAACFSVASEIETKIIDITGRTTYCSQNHECNQCLCSKIPDSACNESHLFGAKQAMRFGGGVISSSVQ